MNIYILRSEQTFGPYSEAEFIALAQNGSILESDFAWREGLTEWIPVKNFVATCGPKGTEENEHHIALNENSVHECTPVSLTSQKNDSDAQRKTGFWEACKEKIKNPLYFKETITKLKSKRAFRRSLVAIILIFTVNKIFLQKDQADNDLQREGPRSEWNGKRKLSPDFQTQNVLSTENRRTIDEVEINLTRVIFDQAYLRRSQIVTHYFNIDEPIRMGQRTIACKFEVKNSGNTKLDEWYGSGGKHAFEARDENGESYLGQDESSDHLRLADPDTTMSGWVFFRIPKEKHIESIHWKTGYTFKSNNRNIFTRINFPDLESLTKRGLTQAEAHGAVDIFEGFNLSVKDAINRIETAVSERKYSTTSNKTFNEILRNADFLKRALNDITSTKVKDGESNKAVADRSNKPEFKNQRANDKSEDFSYEEADAQLKNERKKGSNFIEQFKNKNPVQDLGDLIRKMTPLADQGSLEANHFLGWTGIQLGLKNREISVIVTGIGFLKNAAVRGSALAAYDLGQILINDKYCEMINDQTEIENNKRDAKRWFQKSSDLGLKAAKLKLAEF